MSLYLDTSALLKRYLEEPDSDRFDAILRSDPVWVTAAITLVEVRRNLTRLLKGSDLSIAREQFGHDWDRCHVVELDHFLCVTAAEIAELTLARSLDALHLAAIQRAGSGALPLVTADLRQAQAARALGWTTLGC
ncbi:MAG: type II toxin-antitoxin system VapC family toxin [Egibacteraceae bacterium]